jgi:N-acetylated-alpha-linked acidic dipeptidase
MEHTLTNEKGLPGRDWFRHMIYAPGLLTGYGVKTLPGVREAIEQQKWTQADEYSTVIADTLAGYCDRLDQATALLTAAR